MSNRKLESGELKHGYFTYYLLQALKSGRGNTPLSQINASVAQQVAQRVSASGMHQHPAMSRRARRYADFALGVEGNEPIQIQL